jgi:hypothetical protein
LPAARSPRIAADRFLQALGAILRCVTDRHLSVPYEYRVGDLHAAYFEPQSEPASLRAPHGGPRGLFLHVLHLYEIVETEHVPNRRTWDVETRMYEYSLLDRDGRELLAYHWQPGPGFAGPDHPHLHVSAALNARIDAMSAEDIDLDDLHIATGPVTLAAIARMLIEEFGVAPRRGDWREVLDRNEASI